MSKSNFRVEGDDDVLVGHACGTSMRKCPFGVFLEQPLPFIPHGFKKEGEDVSHLDISEGLVFQEEESKEKAQGRVCLDVSWE